VSAQPAPKDILAKAAMLLEEHAADLERSHTIEGKWIDLDEYDIAAREECETMRALAHQLRGLAQLRELAQLEAKPNGAHH
jgi:hypothetical protein